MKVYILRVLICSEYPEHMCLYEPGEEYHRWVIDSYFSTKEKAIAHGKGELFKTEMCGDDYIEEWGVEEEELIQ